MMLSWFLGFVERSRSRGYVWSSYDAQACSLTVIPYTACMYVCMHHAPPALGQSIMGYHVKHFWPRAGQLPGRVFDFGNSVRARRRAVVGIAPPNPRHSMPSYGENSGRFDGGPVIVEVQQDEARAGRVHRLDGEPAEHRALSHEPCETRRKRDARRFSCVEKLERGFYSCLCSNNSRPGRSRRAFLPQYNWVWVEIETERHKRQT